MNPSKEAINAARSEIAKSKPLKYLMDGEFNFISWDEESTIAALKVAYGIDLASVQKDLLAVRQALLTEGMRADSLQQEVERLRVDMKEASGLLQEAHGHYHPIYTLKDFRSYENRVGDLLARLKEKV